MKRFRWARFFRQKYRLNWWDCWKAAGYELDFQKADKGENK